jgi:formamidopyrimidine-DNA glycosylase
VHFLHKHVVGRTLKAVPVQEDDIIYGKVGCSATAFKKALTGKKVIDAQQQGKYFWLVMSSPPHPLLHLGMTGWMRFSNDDSTYYKPAKGETADWPPRFWKFILETAEAPHPAAAFVDARRLGRIRLIDCPAEEMRKTPPLSLNGPDPVRDKDVLTSDWLMQKLGAKRVPIKAWLLDQANVSGVGNWVADEVMYHSRTHPEQYTNTLRPEQVTSIHNSLMYVCDTAVECNGDSSRFPDDWLMRHRWGKGKKDSNKLPNGKIITFLTVGGRTSAIVPSVQKKTGAVVGDVDGEEGVKAEEDDDEDVEEVTGKGKARGRKRKAPDVNGDGGKRVQQEGHQAEETPSSAKKAKASGRKETAPAQIHVARNPKSKKAEDAGRRRSGRVRGQ